MENKLMFGALVRDCDKACDFYTTKPTAAAATQAYLKSLRAAEMADWEMTGGDYVLPAFATNSFHYGMAGICRQVAKSSPPHPREALQELAGSPRLSIKKGNLY